MVVTLEPKLKTGSMIPGFRLMSDEGRSVSVWDYKGRRNVVLAFLPAEASAERRNFLRAVSDARDRYQEEDTVFLAIVGGGAEAAVALRAELRGPFPVLYDEDGRVTKACTREIPAVFVADKFGEVQAGWAVGPGGLYPTQKQIQDTVELANLDCPECGAPVEWP